MLPRVRPPPRDPKQQGRDQAAPGDKLRSSGALLKAANAMADMRVLESGYEPKYARTLLFASSTWEFKLFDCGSSGKPSDAADTAPAPIDAAAGSERSVLIPHICRSHPDAATSPHLL